MVGGASMEKVTITNKHGESITLGNAAPYYLETLDGVGEVPVSIESQKSPYQDGSTYIDSVFENRAISIEGMIVTRDNPASVKEARRKMQRVLNPKLGEVVLKYEQKEIKSIVESTPIFPSGRGNKGIYYQKYLIHLLCHQPFWLDSFIESREIVAWIGGMTFPLILPTAFAMKGSKTVNIVNESDVEVPVSIEFKGPATNPRVSNKTTGQYIQVNRELVLGDMLVITTDFGAKRVEINGENVFNWIDLGSYFWQLQPGDNIIEYSSDDPVEPAAVTISYRNRYVGV
jgi:hypothetical protein